MRVTPVVVPVKHVSTTRLERVTTDSKEWSTVETMCQCEDDKILRLAFHVDGEIGIDDVVVRQAARDKG